MCFTVGIFPLTADITMIGGDYNDNGQKTKVNWNWRIIFIIIGLVNIISMGENKLNMGW